ncbi:MAG: FAD-dependent oxidoreductase, partial [Planctomycetales bacterium]|nr:FAD-dependent oxidoreductase [Planctomycetales bacterium]
LPPRLGVIGAGPIGCEMAQAFARFGSQVTLIENEHGVLTREDRDAAEIVQRSLERDGVRLLCCGRKLEVSRSEPGIRLQLESHDQTHDVTVDQLLVATGRAANVERLNLSAVGVVCDQHGVVVNDRLQTTNPRIYAAGDVCSRYKFTHAADFMARIVVQNALFLGRRKVSRLVIPWCTYTSPELARVGMIESEAADQQIEVETFTQEFRDIDRAVLAGEDDGFARIHVRRGSDKVVGATIVGSHAGEMISEICLAMTNNVGLKKISAAIHPYPTQTEAIRKLGDQYNRTRLTPTVQWMFEKWLRWTR